MYKQVIKFTDKSASAITYMYCKTSNTNVLELLYQMKTNEDVLALQVGDWGLGNVLTTLVPHKTPNFTES